VVVLGRIGSTWNQRDSDLQGSCSGNNTANIDRNKQLDYRSDNRSVQLTIVLGWETVLLMATATALVGVVGISDRYRDRVFVSVTIRTINCSVLGMMLVGCGNSN